MAINSYAITGGRDGDSYRSQEMCQLRIKRQRFNAGNPRSLFTCSDTLLHSKGAAGCALRRSRRRNHLEVIRACGRVI